jgi:hypothetical protein
MLASKGPQAGIIPPVGQSAMNRDALTRLQAEALNGGPKARRLRTSRDAERFLERVGLALRYQPTRGLPLASLRAAAGGPGDRAALEQSIQLTNHLLASKKGIEVAVIADRLVLVDRSLMSSLYALVRGTRAPDDRQGLSPRALAALGVITTRRTASAGDVRRQLGLPLQSRNDPTLGALAELQRALLVDRGPFAPPGAGIPYLRKVGYPYHLFHAAHADLCRESRRLTRDVALQQWIAGYLRGAACATTRDLAKLFKRFLTPAEVDHATAALAARRAIDMNVVGAARYCVWRG